MNKEGKKHVFDDYGESADNVSASTPQVAMIGFDAVDSALDYIINQGVKFKRGELSIHNSEFIEFIASEKLYNRLSKPFGKIEQSLDLLFVLNYAVSSNNTSVKYTINRMFEEIIQRKFPISLVNLFVKPRTKDRKWTLYFAEIVFEIAHLFGYMCRSYPDIDQRVFQNWDVYWNHMVQININDLLTADITEREICMLYDFTKRLNRQINDECGTSEFSSPFRDFRRSDNVGYRRNKIDYDCEVQEYDASKYRYDRKHGIDEYCDNRNMVSPRVRERNVTNHYELDQTYAADDRYRFEYNYDARQSRQQPCSSGYKNAVIVDDMDCHKDSDEFTTKTSTYRYRSVNREKALSLCKRYDKIEPPDEFRKLTSVPTISDYFLFKEPFVRRVTKNGIYKSIEHYLDVQFRLFREDLVSPLRDGIDFYFHNKTSLGKSDGLNLSSLKIYYLDQIEAKQVSENGRELRYATFSGRSIEEFYQNREAIKGSSLVLLSSDGFAEEMHLALVVDFEDVAGQISLEMLEEMKERSILSNKSYMMAEANSYLPSYRYVLQNLKDINRFVPIPLERYIVHGKRTIFRPAYQRQPKTEEQLADEKEIEDYYNEVRSAAHARRIAEGKEFNKETKRSQPSIANNKTKKKFKFFNPIGSFSEAENNDYDDENESDSDEEGKQLSQPIFKTAPELMTAENGDRIQIDGVWYQISTLLDNFHPDYMDESQRVAFCHSFMREISLIQGPPGCGKSYVASKILETILINRDTWGLHAPVLLLAYTNKAIDNLLENVLEIISEHSNRIIVPENEPKIIRYGSNCTSETLSKYDRQKMNAEFKECVPPKIQQKLNSAYTEKRRIQRELAAASYALYNTNKELISFNYISKVMSKKFLHELCHWAVTHKDSKGNILNQDEAFACWLLDWEFKKLDFYSCEKNKETLVNDNDNTVEDDIVNYNSDEEDEELIDRILKKINLNCTGKNIMDGVKNNTEDESICEYYTKKPWEITKSAPSNVTLGIENKKSVSSEMGIGDTKLLQAIENEKEMILQTPPLKEEDLDDINYVFSLQRPKRWALYRYWCQLLRNTLEVAISDYIKKFRNVSENVMKEHVSYDACIAKRARVIGATTSGASRLRGMLELVKPKILIIEEAAQICEPHVLSAMISSIEHVIMIGDHKQLPPTSSVHELGEFYGLNISMFERLADSGLPYSQLRTQHRMNLNISDTLVKPWFYHNINNGDNVKNYPPVKGMVDNLFLWSHTGKEESMNGLSWMNQTEIDMIVPLVRHLLMQTYKPSDITVITTYCAQRDAIIRRFSTEFPSDNDVPGLSVATVDSFQGCENKIVILSLVRSHRGKDLNSGIGFLTVKNRVCVGLTRAQHGMYMIGNAAYLANNSLLWNNIVFESMHPKHFVDYTIYLKCQSHGHVIAVERPEDFIVKSPLGGCCEICNIIKKCGHRCIKFCHPDFENEHLHPCYSNCLKICPNPKYNHPCFKKCYEECGACMEYVELVLKCGHKIITTCCRSEKAACDKPCTKTIDCGHVCGKKCGDDCTKLEDCQQLVEMPLSCGHTRKIACNELRSSNSLKCIERCDLKVLGCDHQCAERCGAPCTSECQAHVDLTLKCGHTLQVKCFEIDVGGNNEDGQFECKTLVPKKFEKCGHICEIKCFSDPNSEECSDVCKEKLSKCGHICGDKCGRCSKTGKHVCQSKCDKILTCGHRCASRCGNECPPCEAYCMISCTHMVCGFGNNGYGRSCNEMCVMCTRVCGNRCIHRSCSKLCMEQCDVQPCNEVCRLPLKCNHACLGLCGEKCPRLCGTCNHEKYIELISIMKNENNKFHRLMEIVTCGHIFPVQYLDDYVQAQINNNQILKCPKPDCGKLLNGINRFSKYIKMGVYKQNVEKMKCKLLNFEKVLTDTLDIRTKTIRLLNMKKGGTRKINFTKNMQDDFKLLQKVVLKLSTKMANIGNDKYLVVYYFDLMRCIHALAELMNNAILLRHWSSKSKVTPKIDIIILDVFRFQNVSVLQWKEIVEAITIIQDLWEINISGAIIPKLRFKLARILTSLQILMLNRKLFSVKSDLVDKSAQSLRKLYIEFFKKEENLDFTSLTDNVSASTPQVAMIGFDAVDSALDYIINQGVKFKRGELSIHNSEFIEFIASEKLYNRLSKPFGKIEQSLDLLFVLNYAVSSNNTSVKYTINRMFEEIIQRKFPISLVNLFVKPRTKDRKWTLYFAEIVFEIAHLFGYMCRSYPDIDQRVFQNWDVYWNHMVQININDLLTADITEREICMLYDFTKRLNRQINDECGTSEFSSPFRDFRRSDNVGYRRNKIDYDCEVQEYDASKYRYDRKHGIDEYCDNRNMVSPRVRERNVTNHYELDQTYAADDRYRFEYNYDARQSRQQPCSSGYKNAVIVDDMDCHKDSDEFTTKTSTYRYRSVNREKALSLCKRYDKIEPPDEFRKLTSVPTISDYFLFKEPFVRRVTKNGIYKSIEHYLDVQFRLFREDLVSPLRDGIDFYFHNKTSLGKSDGLNLSSLKIYYLDQIEAKQVSENGRELRYATFSGRSIEEFYQNREAIKGSSLVLLSSDGFAEEMHLALVVDFEDVAGQISLEMLEEMKERSILSNKSYMMAEANSYLPSYRYVLQNLKDINRFVPIPLERYIVHGKRTIFRPAYQRQPKTEEQLADEKEIEDYYNEVRSAAHARRIAEGKEFNKETKRSQPSIANNKTKKKFKFFNPIGSFSEAENNDYDDENESDSDEEGKQLSQPIFKTAPELMTAENGDRIQIDGVWYQISTLLDNFHPDYMDESQRVAFCHSFMREISLIQGPPGCGKSYVASKILETILINRDTWGLHAPVLLLAYTNKAIDNLLENVLEIISEHSNRIIVPENEPKIIRYGSNCTSETLSKYDRQKMNAEFKECVPPKIQQKLNSAYTEKRRIQRELAAASYALYNTNKELISFNYISKVMSKKFLHELCHWAVTHKDSKGNILNQDEAFACWLLDWEFKKLDFYSCEKNKETLVNDNDNTVEDDIVNYNSDEEDEELIDRILKKINLNCTGKNIMDGVKNNTEDESICEYYTKKPWEITKSAPSNVTLGIENKKSVSSEMGIGDTKLLQAIENEKEMILQTPPLKEEDLDDINYVFSLQRPKRWALYRYWCQLLRNTLEVAISDYIKKFRNVSENVMKEHVSYDACIAKRARVIGATTSGASRLRGMLELVKPKILIIEEAAQICEPHVLSAMISSIEHVIMIGDHKQLPPTSSVHELGEFYGLNISMFERLADSGLPYSQLRTQHRMNLNISDTLVKPWFYHNINNGDNVKNYPPVKGMVDNLFLWSHTGKEESMNGLSWMNQTEIDMIVPLVRHLLMQTYKPSDITVITTYCAQRDAIIRRFSTEFPSDNDVPGLSVATVDSFQGCENKIVILSLVRSHRGKDLNSGIGFLTVKNRVCVGLTRAQHGMYMIGNAAYLANNSLLWNNIVFESMHPKHFVDYTIYLKCQSHGHVIAVERPEDFIVKSPLGGCCEICNIIKKCGHRCIKFCHPDFENEHLHPCYSNCLKICPNPKYNHPCFKKCYEECGACMEYVELVLKCGHKIITTCCRSEKAACDKPCTKTIDCGHVCGKKCGDDCTKLEDCQQLVEMPLSCGHTRKIACNELRSSNSLKCIERCDLKVLGCDHQCAERCGAPCTSECQAHVDLTLKCGHTLQVKCFEIDVGGNNEDGQFECKTLVPKKFEKCGHICEIKCFSDPNSEECSDVCKEKLSKCGHICGDKCGRCSKTGKHVCQSKCDKILTCGHRCASRCGNECPPCEAYCMISCTHMVCGFGNNGYGRSCNEMCVMCTRVCGNRCIHRSCSKLCMEQCDVQPCNEVCRLPLKCNHACLGLCGEKCPRLCGTCNHEKYIELISIMKNENNKFHRLMEIVTCGHIFPVQYLDDYVQAQINNNQILKCPKPDCGKLLNGINRFSKYIKMGVYKQNVEKMKCKLLNFEKVLTDTLDIRTKTIRLLNMKKGGTRKINFTKNMQDDFKLLQKVVLKLSTKMANIGNDKYLVVYYFDLMRCIHALAELMNNAILLRHWSSKSKVTPKIDIIILDVFRFQNVSVLQWKEIVEAITIIQDLWEINISGAIIPKLRFKLARILTSLQILMLNRKLFSVKSDLVDKSAQSLRKLYIEFFKKEENLDFTSLTAVIEKEIEGSIDIFGGSKEFIKWDSLNIPDF